MVVAAKRAPEPDAGLYTLGQVQRLIGAGAVRARNLSSVAAYGIQPAVVTGAGPGQRRLFDWYGVVKLAVANRLFEYGFRPDAIGLALGVLATCHARDRHFSRDWTLVRELTGWHSSVGGLRPFDEEIGAFVLRLRPVVAELEARRSKLGNRR